MQLDSISTVERSHRIVLASRVGIYPQGTVSRLLGEGRVFEYWAHEASLVPVEDFPLFRWRMDGRGHWGTHERALDEHPEVVEHVLAEIRARGALGSRDFDGRGRRRDVGVEAGQAGARLALGPRRAVDRGPPGLSAPLRPDRARDPARRARRARSHEAQALRSLVLRAVHGRGALTESGIAEHYRVPGRTAAVRPHVQALEAEGLLRRLRVADDGPDVLVPGEAQLGERVSPGPRSSRRSTTCSGTARSPSASSASSTSWRSTSRRPSASTATTCCRCCAATGSWAAPTSSPTAGRGCCRLLSFHREPRVRDSAALRESLERALERLARAAGLDGVAG